MADAPPSPSPSPSSSPSDVLSRYLETPPTLVQEKIERVFDNLKDSGMLLQFWAPVKTTGGRWLLTTSDQPFCVSEESDCGKKYRSCSVRYQYNIDMNNLEYNIDMLCSTRYQYNNIDNNILQVEEDPSIINGGPARAFLNRIPVLLPDLRVHRMSPLESSAVQCGIFRSIMLPVFDPSDSFCVGVLECSTRSCCNLATMSDDVLYVFRREGIKTFDAASPEKTVCGLAHARDEIKKALDIIWPKFRLDLVQVWIAYKDEKHVVFSSSLEDSQTKRTLGIKLIDRCRFSIDDYENEHARECFVDYSSICHQIPLEMGDGLIGKTLKNHKPRFIKKLSKLSDNQPLMMVRHDYFEGEHFECSCFVICLRSTETNDLDYVFEFIWQEVPNYVILLESLLLSLKSCLPNFKYASGGELGDELSIIDVADSTNTKTKFFRIFKGNKASSASKALCKTTPISLSEEGMIEASRNLYVSLSTLKRKRKDQSDKNEEDNKEMYLDENTVTVKAEYAGDLIKFSLPISSATIVAIEKEIGKGFELNPANYKLKYLDKDGDWILLKSDEDIKVCLKECRNLTSIVRLLLLPRQLSDPAHAT